MKPYTRILDTNRLLLGRLACLIDPDIIASQRVAQEIETRLEQKRDDWKGDGIPFWIYSVEI